MKANVSQLRICLDSCCSMSPSITPNLWPLLRWAASQPRPRGGWCPLPDSLSLCCAGDFFLQEMVSDWEQCVNSPVTLDKPARRPVTGTYGMFDRERGWESHWMIKWCFSPFGNVMLSGNRADHRSLSRFTVASLWHLLQGPGDLRLVSAQFWHSTLGPHTRPLFGHCVILRVIICSLRLLDLLIDWFKKITVIWYFVPPMHLGLGIQFKEGN